MIKLTSLLLFTGLILFSSGCAAHYREHLRDVEQTQLTPFYYQTMAWVNSATATTPAPAALPAFATLTVVPSATSSPDQFLLLAAEFFQVAPDSIQAEFNALSDNQQWRDALRNHLTWESLRLAVAVSNPAVKAARETWQAALKQYDQAEFLDALIGQYRSFTRYLQVSAGQPLHQQMTQMFFPFPNTIALKGEVVREQVRLAELEWQRTLREKVIEAGQVYYDYQYVYRAERTTKENIALVENMLHVIEDLYRAGVASQPDLIRTQTELERQKNEGLDFQAQKESRRAQLNALLGKNDISFGDPDDKNEPLVKLTEIKLLQIANESRQEILMQEAMVARMQVMIRMGEVMNRPSPGPGTSRFERGMMPEASVEMSMPSYGLQSKIPTRPDYAQAESYLQEMRERLAGEESTLNQVISETEGLAKSLLQELDISQREVHLVDAIVLPQNQSTYESVLSNYQAGNTSFIDLLDAERELIRARLESHSAHRDLNQTLLRLVNVAGRFLP